MYLLLTDETNRIKSQDCKFLVYGGIFFKIEDLVELDNNITLIRKNAGFALTDEFKFDTHSRPKNVSIETFNKAKNDVIDLCLKFDCKFIAYVALHDIISKVPVEIQLTFAADHVIGRFNKYLQERQEEGICIIDNLPIKTNYKYLSEKFTVGLKIGDSITPLENIKLYASTCSNASNVSSLIDILLGSFRYCINNPKNIDIATIMIHKVINLMWHKKQGDNIYIGERGLIMRPVLEKIRVKAYRLEYQALIDHIEKLLKDEIENRS